MPEYQNNEPVIYQGRGFIGFDKNQPEAIFKKYENTYDAWINYKGGDVLVYTHELKKPEPK